jgi:hypothetical protein
MEVIKKGSIESLLVPLRDRLGNIQSLGDVTSLKFDTKAKADDADVEIDKIATFDVDLPMTAICPIDSTLAGYDAGQEYKLYLKYTAGSESPVLGPIKFRVEDD